MILFEQHSKCEKLFQIFLKKTETDEDLPSFRFYVDIWNRDTEIFYPGHLEKIVRIYRNTNLSEYSVQSFLT